MRKIGCTVAILSSVGGGVPDLLVGYRGFNFIVEIKEKGRRYALTDDQVKFHKGWRGLAPVIIETFEEFLEFLKEFFNAKQNANKLDVGIFYP